MLPKLSSQHANLQQLPDVLLIFHIRCIQPPHGYKKYTLQFFFLNPEASHEVSVLIYVPPSKAKVTGTLPLPDVLKQWV